MIPIKIIRSKNRTWSQFISFVCLLNSQSHSSPITSTTHPSSPTTHPSSPTTHHSFIHSSPIASRSISITSQSQSHHDLNHITISITSQSQSHPNQDSKLELLITKFPLQFNTNRRIHPALVPSSPNMSIVFSKSVCTIKAGPDTSGIPCFVCVPAPKINGPNMIAMFAIPILFWFSNETIACKNPIKNFNTAALWIGSDCIIRRISSVCFGVMVVSRDVKWWTSSVSLPLSSSGSEMLSSSESNEKLNGMIVAESKRPRVSSLCGDVC